MKRKIIYMLFILPFGFLFCSCTDILEPDSSQQEENKYLYYSSFENKKNASLSGWSSPGAPLVKFSSEVPPSGGKFSVLLKAVDLGAILKTSFPLSSGKIIYNFSFWGKNSRAGGRAEFYYVSSGEKILRKYFYVNSQNWSNYSFQDTLNAVENDSLMIILSGSSSDTPQGITWFDLCKVQRLN